MDLFSGLNLDREVASFKTSTQSAMKSVREGTLTAVDATAKRIKEGIAIKSPRDTTVVGKITEYRDKAVGELDGLIGMVTGGLLKTADITKAIRVGPDGISLNDDALITAASKELGIPVNGKSGVVRKINSVLGTQFTKLTGLNPSGILTTDGKTFRVGKNWRGQVGKQVLGSLGKITDVDEFIDYSVRGAVYNSLMDQIIDYGMSDSFKKVWDAYPPGFELIRRDAVIDGMQKAITNGDLESMSKLIELLETEGRNVLLSKYPQFVEKLFSNFKFDTGAYPEDYPRLLEMLKQILLGVIGPEWYLKTTAFGKVYNLALLQRVSADMKLLLMSWDEVAPLVCTAGTFREGDSVKELRRQFPSAPQFAV